MQCNTTYLEIKPRHGLLRGGEAKETCSSFVRSAEPSCVLMKYRTFLVIPLCSFPVLLFSHVMPFYEYLSILTIGFSLWRTLALLLSG